MKPIGLFKRRFEKPNKTMSFFRSAFQSTLLKQTGEVFLFCVMNSLTWFRPLCHQNIHGEQTMEQVHFNT